MDITQEQVIEEIDNLSQAMLGMGRRTPLEHYSSVRTTRSSEFTASFADQNKAPASFAEQNKAPSASFAEQPLRPDEGAIRSSESLASFAEQIQEPSASFAEQRMRPVLSQSVMQSNGANEHVIPSTTLRKNITARRSRGRPEEPARDPKDMVGVMKRSKGRLEDQEYRRASLGGGTLPGASKPLPSQGTSRSKYGGPPLPGPEILRRTRERMTAEMTHRTRLRVASQMSVSPPTAHCVTLGENNPIESRTPVNNPIESRTPVPVASHTTLLGASHTTFLQRDIPSKKDHPQLHAEIMDLMAIRRQYHEEMEEAMADGDERRCEYAQRQQMECNGRMRDLVRACMLGSNNDQGSSSEKTASTSVMTEEKFVSIDDLPIPNANRVLGGQDQYGQPGMEHHRERNPNGFSAQTFRIWIGYLDSSTQMIVWDSMPLMNVYDFALRWIQQAFRYGGTCEELMIISQRWDGSEIVLPFQGVICDIPLNDDDYVEITVEHTRPNQPRRLQSRSAHPLDRTPQFEYPVEQRTVLNSSKQKEDDTVGSKSYDKIRQTFKCAKFNGNARDWKSWNKNLMRYLSIWDLDYVLDPDFLDELPLSATKRRDNKLVYYILEEAVQGSSLASSYVHQAPLNHGFEAYYTLLDGFVFAGTTTASLLLNELTNFRFLKDETPTAMCLRLQELFQDLQLLPGDAAMVFNDTQRIGYLLGALRHEKAWEHVHSTITSAQIQGKMTFAQACSELRVRCEATRANDVMDRPVGDKKVKAYIAHVKDGQSEDLTPEKVMAYISTMAMKHNQDTGSSEVVKTDKGRKGKNKPLLPCLAKDCSEQTPFPLCGTHYHSLIAAKIPSIELKQNYGSATFNAETQLVVYPDKVPRDRMPSNIKRVRAAAAAINKPT